MNEQDEQNISNVQKQFLNVAYMTEMIQKSRASFAALILQELLVESQEMPITST